MEANKTIQIYAGTRGKVFSVGGSFFDRKFGVCVRIINGDIHFTHPDIDSNNVCALYPNRGKFTFTKDLNTELGTYELDEDLSTNDTKIYFKS